ncbi:MAG: HEAT repeat domain-containing protein, partial [Isosphaeraceae bacterium]|nr:HEAT repeat domain-containing protein [Isosphaeraceae bacterium]
FSKGTYYLEVNANHPDYILRTRKLPVPPYEDPQAAVEAGMHYIMNVGDAWFAQVPREGNIYVRAANIHDTGTRCTACHPSVFSTEANLVAHRNGYPIRSKSNFQYVVDRLYNSITPLYGDDGLYWQRFIAIPLQAQGKQGGIIADVEREVTGRASPTFERFGPFLQAAWAERSDLPPDEQNGVVPLDSKFGFAWRDWRVLTEMARRTGREDYARAAANIAQILNDPAADRRVETLQDRIHRLYAWWLTDPQKNADRIAAEAKALLDLQNEDGGWHELDTKRGPSAVYTTGQLTWTLLQIGFARDDPRIARALKYLLAQQQAFGGWFQTTTHENFRTPMRETRYAVEALAEAFPKPGAPLSSWGNRDGGPARRPRRDTLVHTLDDLENLWDVPEADRPRYAREIATLLDHPEPLVRALAASCLGRLGREEAVGPLVRRLSDPSKIVWRAAAWALRRLGNQGIGVEAIRAALDSPDPLVRRGATRIFAYQFYGMDQRLDIAHRLLTLTADPDLWTRLQALKTLRQWFYRTADAAFQRRIVYTYLSRMAVPEVPVVRRNLGEGMYIMLDENLGGGVSLHKNIASLPERMRPGILQARREVERGVLLTPLLSALASANDLQREAILRSFDGSFFKGRFYARRPTGMLDVGNDREFGFLYEPPTDLLDRAFAAVFAAETRPEVRRQALLLASFFNVPGRTGRPAIQAALLKSLADPDPGVREAARKAVGDDLSLQGVENDPERLAAVLAALRGPIEDQAVLIRALSRNPRLLEHPELVGILRSLLSRDDAALLLRPVLGSPVFSDGEAIEALHRGWDRAPDPKERLALLEVLFARRGALDVEEPAEPVQDLLKAAVNDPSAVVRERALSVVSGLGRLWRGGVSTRLLLSALSDDTPSLRQLGLKLAASKEGFWARPDAREHLLRLLVDPDAKVRAEALKRIEEHRLLVSEPKLARRVKALASDPALKGRATAALVAQGFDPEAVEADIELLRPRLLNLASFRQQVNPIFYRVGEDGYACVHCHANHTILRIAEADPARGISGEALMTNYNSVLKVINLGDPESSLVLRKPRSPQGQGGADPSSPTGLTHVGGPRWESTDHPAYKALLTWIRAASASSATGAAPSAARFSADSYSPGYEPAQAGDGDLGTLWRTEFVGASPGYPHELVVDLGAMRKVEGLLYVPRQDGPDGRVKDYEVRLSDDGQTWTEPVARGRWANDPTFKFVALPGRPARYVQLRGLSEVDGRPSMSAAELVIDSSPIPTTSGEGEEANQR